MKSMIFSTPMVQAILQGRKTMTRRLINSKPTCDDMVFDEIQINPIVTDNSRKFGGRVIKGTYAMFLDRADIGMIPYKSRFQTGDILYVRETWRKVGFVMPALEYKASFLHESIIPWRSPATMPKYAARIFLRVTDVRVERLQGISVGDIGKEGIWVDGCKCNMFDCEWCMTGGEFHAKYQAFEQLWDSINAKKPGCSWGDNPYVWVISFERVEKPEEVTK